MEEKVFKTVNAAGVVNLVAGITILVSGIVWGVLLLINSAKLLRSKKDMMI